MLSVFVGAGVDDAFVRGSFVDFVDVDVDGWSMVLDDDDVDDLFDDVCVTLFGDVDDDGG